MTTAEAVLKPDHGSSRKHFIFSEEHERLRESIGRFVEKELAPHAEKWEEETFEDWVFTRMGELGFLGLSMPEEYGGQGGDYLHDAVLTEELARCGSGGLAAGIGAHIGIATPPIARFGTLEQRRRWLEPAIRAERIAALLLEINRRFGTPIPPDTGEAHRRRCLEALALC